MLSLPSVASWLALLITESLSYRERVAWLQRSQGQASLGLALSANDQRRIDAATRWLEQSQHHLVCLDDPRYPPGLLQIDQPPLGLFVVGQVEQLAYPSIAIVGSRHSTALGEATAKDFAAELCSQGICVVSGLARGIDAAAHEGALIGKQTQPNAPSTIAVLGTGINLFYPASNRRLQTTIAEQGCLVSEYPLDYPALRENFPRRNRIVAGMSRGVLIVEAARQSGSLITAKQALAYGREVFAVPGSIHSPTSKGCHQLLREGATLCESVDDIVTALQWRQPELNLALPASATNNSAELPQEQQAQWHWFGAGPITLEDLCARSGQTLHTWLAQLGTWEMNGLIERTSDGRYQRAVI